MKYMALDVGNVLVHLDFQPFIRQLSKQFNVHLEDAEYFLNRSHSLHDMGLTTMAYQLREHFDIKSPDVVRELLDMWGDVITPNYEVLDTMLELMDTHDVKAAIVSNVGLEHSARMAKVLSYGGFFEKCDLHLSCYVGARKPTKLYYQSFLSQYPEYTGCTYVDDLRENLDASEPFGFRTYRFALNEHTNKETSIYLQDLKNFVLETPEENCRRH